MGETDLTGKIEVHYTGNWDTYTQLQGETSVALPAGTYQLRLEIEDANCNIDKVSFRTSPLHANKLEGNKFDGVYNVYSIMGVFLGSFDINNGDLSTMKGILHRGVYPFCKQDGIGESKRIFLK